MEWKAPYIVYRVGSDGNVDEVYHARDLKKAQYWINYIAEPGDVLCKTPVHPRHSKKSEQPEYWCHKHKSGTSSRHESQWKELMEGKNFDFNFPTEQLKEPSA